VGRGKLLHHALDWKEDIIEMINLLVERGAPLDSNMYEPGTYAWKFYFWMGNGTSLQKAVELGRVDLVQHLLRKGADARTMNPKGETPLDVTRRSGNLEIVALLGS
jgi:ankyrin repeat protein